jgi:hypothetical protein
MKPQQNAIQTTEVVTTNTLMVCYSFIIYCRIFFNTCITSGMVHVMATQQIKTFLKLAARI